MRDTTQMASTAQLMVLKSVLQSQGIHYWLDSGTLLGMVREGQLIGWDHDIDISIWWDPEISLAGLRKSLRQAGYHSHVKYYKGNAYEIRLNHKESDRQNILPVGIKMFRACNDFAYCPVVKFTSLRALYAKQPLRQAMERHALRFANRLNKYVFKKLSPKNVMLRRWVEFIGCWWVPARFFAELKILPNGLIVPYLYDEYLQYRYGEWRIPNREWDYLTDDPSLVRITPEEMCAADSISTVEN